MSVGIDVVILVVLIVGVGAACLGYSFALASQRREGGGKTQAELRQEHEAYRGEVSEHFEKTAALLQEMTDKYRDVYQHMANGAQNLCPSEDDQLTLAQLRGGLLTGPNADLADGGHEEPSNPGVVVPPPEDVGQSVDEQPSTPSGGESAVDGAPKTSSTDSAKGSDFFKQADNDHELDSDKQAAGGSESDAEKDANEGSGVDSGIGPGIGPGIGNKS